MQPSNYCNFALLLFLEGFHRVFNSKTLEEVKLNSTISNRTMALIKNFI